MLILRKLTQDRRLLWYYDPAVAWPEREAFPSGSSGYEQWEAARKAVLATFTEFYASFDLALIPIRPGWRPTVFVIGGLTVAQAAHVANYTAVGDQERERIAYGVRAIEGMQVERDDGSLVMSETIPREPTPIGPRLGDELMRAFVDSDLRAWIVGQISRASKLDKELHKSDPA